MALVQQVEDGKLVDHSANANAASKAKEKAGGDLNKEDFLKLLVAQMQYQDPLQPQSNTEYVTQLATFSQVEASENMKSTMEQMEANQLVGKTVIMKPTNSTTGETSYVTGMVDYVTREGSNVYLSINDRLYNLADLDTVADTAYMDAVTLTNTFKELVAQLPIADNVSLGDEEKIKAVRKVYDGMDDYQKSFVDAEVLKRLSDAETKLNALIAIRDAMAAGSSDDKTEPDNETENSADVEGAEDGSNS